VENEHAGAEILEQETDAAIALWLGRVEAEPEIITVRLSTAERCAHLPAIFHELVQRLRHPLPLGTRTRKSSASARHGQLRREQGYTAAMMVEELRLLQAAIFEILRKNLERVNFSVLLVEVMATVDEIDSQLAQAMASYLSNSNARGPMNEA